MLHLGEKSEYKTTYDKSLLFPVKRELAREKMKINPSIFYGYDVWNSFEVSYLNIKGKPEVRIVRIIYSSDSASIVESKSLKLYLNSFNMTRFNSEKDAMLTIKRDLNELLETDIKIESFYCNNYSYSPFNPIESKLVDTLDIDINEYSPNSELILCIKNETKREIELHSNLLKTNCPVTGQPDWGTLYIKYLANNKQITEESLLRYVVSYRNAQDFHEACCEKIFSDIYNKLSPEKLLVRCFYTRRGGIDINPIRFTGYTVKDIDLSLKTPRQ